MDWVSFSGLYELGEMAQLFSILIGLNLFQL